MEVFNLTEELEKERKKNKELEERNKVLEKGCKEYRYHIKQMNKIHDNCLDTIEELQDRIDKVIYDLEKTKELNDKHILVRDNIVIHLDIDHIEYLLDILKGDNK